MQGTIEVRRMGGAALEGNHLDDPVERELIVYLPPSYRTGERRYPTLMVLTGYASSGASLLNYKPWEPNFLQRYEQLIAEGCPEAVVVLPDCFTRLGGSQFLDSAATGNYQSYLVEDVLPYVDSQFRTLPHRESRALVGKSSGGFGALRMGLDRPEHFAVLGSHAGDCAFELSIQPRFAEVATAFERHGGAAAFVDTMFAQGGPRGGADFHAMEFAAMAACYAPRLDAERPHGALPFNPRTATLLPEIWQEWLAHDPLVRLRKTPRALADSRLVFLDAGRWDEYGLQFGARMLAELLMNSDTRVQHSEFDGGHMGTGHRYQVSLPPILTALASDSP